MTEKEAKAIEHIKNLADDYKCWSERISHEESLVLCKLLKEIQQYRAIGTVEELKTAMLYVSLAKMHGTVGRAIDACAEYESIGTIEEFKALKEDNRFLEFLYDRISPNEMEQYLSMYKATDIKTNGV